MKKIIIVSTILLASGCRIVNNETTWKNVTIERSTVSDETLQEQTAPKKIGDIAPETSVTPAP